MYLLPQLLSPDSVRLPPFHDLPIPSMRCVCLESKIHLLRSIFNPRFSDFWFLLFVDRDGLAVVTEEESVVI
jgi:hypothetical protein